MATSSRWLARCVGFCRLHPIWATSRPTWVREYDTPKTRLITDATRRRVQTSPRKPKASAPWANKAGSLWNWASLRRGLGPPPLRCRKASTPPSRAWRIHWLTAPLLTPNASAMSDCFQPFCLSSHARIRRISRQSCAGFFSVFFITTVYNRLLTLFRKFWSDQ